MLKEAINKLLQREDLSSEMMGQAMEEIMSGRALPAKIASFLTALRIKGETVEEITSAAEIMRQHVTKIATKQSPLLDTCGTGGDGSGTFNISTIAALVAAGAGVVVAKHGNKSVSSKCGSADLLTKLGVKIDLEPKKIEQCLEKIGFGFLYAPLLHPAMKYATPVRREMGLRTIFNILGPLTNPAGADCQLLGVYDAALTETLANVLENLGSQHVLVVHGADGLDEVTTTGPSQISELNHGKIKTYHISPADVGMKTARPADLKGGDIDFNASIAGEILKGKTGPQRDIVLLNAACAIYAANQAASIKAGITKAAESIDSGQAVKKLELLKELVPFSNTIGKLPQS